MCFKSTRAAESELWPLELTSTDELNVSLSYYALQQEHLVAFWFAASVAAEPKASAAGSSAL